MIPSIVLVTAQGFDELTLDTLNDLVSLLKQPELSIPFDDFIASLESMLAARGYLERLPTLAIRPLVAVERAPSAVSEFLMMIEPHQLVPNMKSPADALSVKAGLYLVNDYIEAAHVAAQAADETGQNTTAAYWHGIMHRREPDYDNARYWFRRVGAHAVFSAIGGEAAGLMRDEAFSRRLRCPAVIDGHGRWDPMAFIDLCEECGRTWDDRAQAAGQLQEIEMRHLLKYTCRAAAGES